MTERGLDRRSLGEGGFTLTEMVIATAVMLAVMGGVFGLIRPAQAGFQAQPELSDMNQRLRVGIATLTRDLMMAGAGLASTSAAVTPYADAITVTYVPWNDTATVAHTYYLDTDAATGVVQLRRDDGSGSDLPVVDHIVGLLFSYFDSDGAELDPAAPDAGTQVRRVRVALRVEATLDSMRGSGALFARRGTSTDAARYLPDHEIEFDVALRNMNRDR